jgi:uncharacterized protein YbaP (TraB family)
MFLRSAATALITLMALPAAAACVGQSYLDVMTDAQRTELDAAIATQPYSEGLTWQAARGNDTLTIVGTMHIFDPRLETIRARVGAAVQNADLVMLEATPEEEAKLQELVVTDPGRLFIVDGPTLPELLDQETWDMLANAASDRGIPSFMAAKMQPWYLSLMLAIPPCAMTDMVNGVRGLDHMITDDAMAAGVPLQAVEPFTTLFDLFKDEPMDDQIDMLRVNMLVPELQQQMFVAMLDQYFAEDVGRLWEMSRIAMMGMADVDPAEATATFNEMEEALLDNRNRNWIPVITQATETNDDIVIAVGAAHLIGERGILRLLENEGWAITRLP